MNILFWLLGLFCFLLYCILFVVPAVLLLIEGIKDDKNKNKDKDKDKKTN